MDMNQFLKNQNHQRKTLIVSSMQRGNALIRHFELETGNTVQNIKVTTINNLVREFYYSLQAKKGYQLKEHLLTKEEAEMFFHGFLVELSPTLSYFNDTYMLNYATTKEIYNKINLIRLNGWKEEVNSNRLKDLKTMIPLFEKQLKENKYLDRVELLKVVLNEIDSIEIEKNYYCLKEDLEQLSNLEKEFLKRLEIVEEVNVFDKKELTFTDLEHLKDRIDFYRGNGAFNEVMYVVYDIAHHHIPFGEVTLLYTTSNHGPIVSSVLSSNNIPSSFVTSKYMGDNPYLSLVRRIMDWAREDYTEKQLEKIFANKVLYVTDGESEENLLEGFSYFDHILNLEERFEDSMILGWGYERNIEFIERAKAIATKESELKYYPIYELHHDLIHIFSDEEDQPYTEDNCVLPYQLLKKIIQFIKSYTISSNDKNSALDKLNEIKEVLYYEKNALPLFEAMELIQDLITHCATKENEHSDTVRCEQLSSWTILNRPYVYLIGLSLKDFSSSTTESPVLTDEEMETVLVEGYKPTIQVLSKMKEQNLYRTLKSFHGEKMVFGYSSFDARMFFRSNPSFFYKDALEYFKGIDETKVKEFVVGNPEEEIRVPRQEFSYMEDNFHLRLPSSSSSSEVFVDCPRRFAYERVLKLPSDDYREFDSTRWLNAAERGTFFHALMERYINSEMILPGDKLYPTEPNLQKIEELAKELKEEILIQTPVAFKELAESETEELLELAKEYFIKLHQSLQESGWRMLSCEQDFKNAEFKVESLTGKEYIFRFRGSIDRVDYRIVPEEKKVLIRVLDYKTGRKENKEKADERGVLLQYAIYKKALMETGETESGENVLTYLKNKIIELEKEEALRDWDYEFDSFMYEFPADQSADEPIVITFDKDETIEPLNIKRLRYVLSVIEENKTYPDIYTLESSIPMYERNYPKEVFDNLVGTFMDKDVSACAYCEYADMCERRKAGII